MDIFDAIKNRRSVRKFKPDSIPDEVIQRILEAAQLAPSAGNLQARAFIIIKDSKVKRKLCKSALNQTFIEEAPVNIVVCADEAQSSAKYGSRGKVLYSIIDATAAAENLLLAVHALGLGSCWIGAFEEENVKKILNLPEGIKPIGIFPIGYPAEKPLPRDRLPLEAVVHKEKYETKKFN